jgi:hypothetical protein
MKKDEEKRPLKILFRFELYCEFLKYLNFYCGSWEPRERGQGKRERTRAEGARN